MRCENCGSDNQGLARFCQACGKPLAEGDEGIRREDMSLSWIAETLQRIGYKAEPNNDRSIILKGDSKPTLVVGFILQPPLLTVQAIWGMKKIPMMKRREFAETINKANGTNWLCTFYTSPDGESLTVSSAMYLPEKVSRVDVAGYVDMFQSAAMGVLNSSGILKFG